MLKESQMEINDFRIERYEKHNFVNILMLVLIGQSHQCKEYGRKD